MGSILVGTASWTDKTLLASGWYPPEISSAEERLGYYASRFPITEVDSTYYTPPSERNSKLWSHRTPDSFTFDVKAFSLFTQHPTRASSLYKDLRPAEGSKNLYLKDLEPDIVEQIWDRFLSALQPLFDNDKLGLILFQFPQWFPIASRNKRYIVDCQSRCAPARICVEFRNKTWLDDQNKNETLDFLITHGISYVCVDMPQGYVSSVPPILAATADPAIVRFHGHSDKWTSKNIYERFGYLYSQAELEAWAPRILTLAKGTEETHVLLNNCYQDYAQTNASQLADLLPRQA